MDRGHEVREAWVAERDSRRRATAGAPGAREGRPFAVDDVLRRIAVRQLGLVAVRQAREEGVSPSAIDRRVRAGLWHPVFRGVVRTTAVRPTQAQFTLAAALATPGSVVAGLSAAFTDGLPVREPGRPVLAVRRGRSARLSGADVIRLGVVLPTRPWHTVRIHTVASTLVLLPRFVDERTLERCLDHCIVKRLTDVARVRGLVESLPPTAIPRRRQLIRLLDDRAGGVRHRSGEEMNVKVWLREAGLGGFGTNVHVPLGDGGTVERDFVWLPQKAILEVSPFVTHGTEEQQARDIEHRRQLVAAGWRIIEATDADLVDRRAFQRCIASLCRILSSNS